jgi:hypothetical protein
LIDRMIETQHDSREYARLRPYFTGLSRDDFLMDDTYERSPSRISRLIAFIGAATRIRQLEPATETGSQTC